MLVALVIAQLVISTQITPWTTNLQKQQYSLVVSNLRIVEGHAERECFCQELHRCSSASVVDVCTEQEVPNAKIKNVLFNLRTEEKPELDICLSLWIELKFGPAHIEPHGLFCWQQSALYG